MQLYFLRHGEADWPEWDRPDDERPLTVPGKKEVRKVADMLGMLGTSLDQIVSSPLPRARQTADIIAACLEVEIEEEKRLGHGFDVSALTSIVRKHRVGSLMIVGHEPAFTQVLFALTGGDCKLSKAGVALVRLEPDDMKGRLLWLFPPKFANLI